MHCCCCCAKIEGKLTKCGNLCVYHTIFVLFGIFLFSLTRSHAVWLWMFVMYLFRCYCKSPFSTQATKLNSFTSQSILFQSFLHLLSTSAATAATSAVEAVVVVINADKLLFFSLLFILFHNMHCVAQYSHFNWTLRVSANIDWHFVLHVSVRIYGIKTKVPSIAIYMCRYLCIFLFLFLHLSLYLCHTVVRVFSLCIKSNTHLRRKVGGDKRLLIGIHFLIYHEENYPKMYHILRDFCSS